MSLLLDAAPKAGDRERFMRIVVLTKPVPDPASATEHLGPDGRLDRSASLAVVNGNDEYALEKALKCVAVAGEGEVILLSMAPANAHETMRKALAMGATRGILVTDLALEGSCTVATTRVLAAALKTLEFDLAFAGVDTSDGGAGVVPAGVAALNGLPYLSCAAEIEPNIPGRKVRVRRITPSGYDVLEAPMPALISGTQALGEPRYPSLKGIMAARSKEITTLSLADLGIDPATVGTAGATTRVMESRPTEVRGATRIIREPADEAARQVVAFLAERRLI
jgi:electron transfer flavoprotein beta subunit